jgi:hypothetical protein
MNNPEETITVTVRTIDAILDSALEDFKEQIRDYDADEDTMHEIADSHVPIYTRDLIAVCLTDASLFLDEPEIEGATTPEKVVQYNIYDRIYQHLSAYWYDRHLDNHDDEEVDEEPAA